jgi:hypothetical protein
MEYVQQMVGTNFDGVLRLRGVASDGEAISIRREDDIRNAPTHIPYGRRVYIIGIERATVAD